MFGGHFLALPVHAGGALVVDLHAVHADVAFAGFRVAGDHAGKRYKAAGILGPALENRKVEERKVVAPDYFLAGAAGDSLRKKLAHLGEHGKHFDFVEEALREFDIHEGSNAFGDFFQRVDIKGEPHPASGAELVDKELRAGMPLHVLKEQGGAARSVFGGAALANAVSDLGAFQDRVRFAADLAQFAGAVERGNPVAEVVVGQEGLRENL